MLASTSKPLKAVNTPGLLLRSAASIARPRRCAYNFASAAAGMLGFGLGEFGRHLDEGVVAGLAALLEGLGPLLAGLGFQDVGVVLQRTPGGAPGTRRGPNTTSQSYGRLKLHELSRRRTGPARPGRSGTRHLGEPVADQAGVGRIGRVRCVSPQ